MQHPIAAAVRRYVLAGALLSALAACNVDFSDALSETTRNSSDMTLSGSVGDGPIVDAEITIYDARGDVVVSGQSDNTANYELEVPAMTAFPLEVTATGGTDLVSRAPADFTLVATVVDPEREIVNLSPFTTFVSRAASCLPGRVDRERLDALWDHVHERWSMGFDPELMPNPLHDPLTEENVAAVVYANEGLAEAFRRTHEALQTTGTVAEFDAMIEGLACDLAAGVLDGAGGESRRAATFLAAAAGVKIEMLAHALHVKGGNAMPALNESLATVMPEADGLRVEDVPITPAFLEQARTLLSVLASALDDETLGRYEALLQATTPENVSALLAGELDADDRIHLEALGGRLALASDAELDTTFEVMRSSLDTDGGSQASLALQATPPGVAPDGRTTLVWSGEGVSECTASGGWSGQRPVSGEETVGPLESDTTFTLSCTGANGSAMAMQTVSVRVARLSWQPPTSTVGGEPLSDLAGFRLHYGTASRSYDTEIELSSPAQTGWELELPPGTYYFAVTAFTAEGKESGYSNEVSRTIH